MNNQYRFEAGQLLILDGGAYRFCFSHPGASTKKRAIEMYESWLLRDEEV